MVQKAEAQHKLLRQQFLKIKLTNISLFCQYFEILIFAGLTLIHKSKIYKNTKSYLASNLWCSTSWSDTHALHSIFYYWSLTHTMFQFHPFRDNPHRVKHLCVLFHWQKGADF
jgi:hypothetical protein